MGKAETISVDLSADLADYVRGVVADGQFPSTDAVVRAALNLWKQRHETDLDHLRALIAEGLASGPAEPWEGIEAIKAEARARWEARDR